MMNGLYNVFKCSLEESTVTTYKKGDASDRGNYRPLQVLRVPSKLLEAIVREGLDEFISDRGPLSNNQWANGASDLAGQLRFF